LKFIRTKLEGAYVIELDPINDERGFFARTWCKDEFDKRGLNTNLVQCNLSQNNYRGTIRGMHYQVPPYSETKLVRCIRGAIFDVIIDLRPNSVTYTEWFAVELTQNNRKMLYVPEGMAHGYQTLEDNSEVFYQVSAPYHSESAKGVRWDDPVFGIQWPIQENLIMSDKDKNCPRMLI